MNIENLKKELINKRSEILFALCEDESIYHPQIIHQLVMDLRSITKLLKLIDGRKE